MQLAMARGLNHQGSHLRYEEWHHLYLGVCLFLLSYAAERRPVLALVLRVAGLLLTWDDAFQHIVQAVSGDLSFRSPLHLVYAWMYDEWGWVRALTQWLDRLFGA